MLLLSPDSGFNSPCGDFAASSSLQSPFYVRKSFQYYSSRRKLEFDSASSSIDKTLGGSCDENASEFKAREIARRLVHLCDSFDVELMSCTIDTQKPSWLSATCRLLKSWISAPGLI